MGQWLWRSYLYNYVHLSEITWKLCSLAGRRMESPPASTHCWATESCPQESVTPHPASFKSKVGTSRKPIWWQKTTKSLRTRPCSKADPTQAWTARADALSRSGQLLNFFLLALCKKGIIYLESKLMTPPSRKILFSFIPPKNSPVSVSHPWRGFLN